MLAPFAGWLCGAIALVASGCSITRTASNAMADALAASGSAFTSDEDPELVREALPFSLKLMESLLANTPDHRGLLVACSRSFTQYAYAFVQMDGDRLEFDDYQGAKVLHERAKKLYLRARDYGLRALAVGEPRFETRLRANAAQTLARLDKSHVEPLYWTCAAWAGAITLSKDDPALLGEIPLVESMLDRAVALDPDFDNGALHAFQMVFEPARADAGARSKTQSVPATSKERARAHFERAVAMSGGLSAGLFVSWAESFSVKDQNLAEFRDLLARALAIDPNAAPGRRLVNILMQRRARWLLEHTDELFLDSSDPSASSSTSP